MPRDRFPPGRTLTDSGGPIPVSDAVDPLPPLPPFPPPPPAYAPPPPPPPPFAPWTASQAVRPRRERWWLHLLLLLLTFGTTTWVGASFAVNFRPSLVPPEAATAVDLGRLLAGALTFSLPLMAILVAHEAGHYIACRRYGIDASPPFFIPFPSLAGTMGAFIRIREPILDKRKLFDVGVAGPIAGFVVALPFLAWGVLATRPNPVLDFSEGTLLFRYPLLVTLAQKALLGQTFSSALVVEHPAFLAAWFGLFVTALNLLPIGQLDGGHALYAVFGRHQRTLAFPLLAVLAVLGFKFPGWWVWAVLLLLMGVRHPRVLDEDEPLDARRRWVALAVLVIFALCFVPVPIEEITPPSAPGPPVERGGTVVHKLHLHPRAEHAG